MKDDSLKAFHERRTQGNTLLETFNDKTIKRYLSLDTSAYNPHTLDKKTKELLGLVASTVLRCDDCITYHLESAIGSGATRQELSETLAIALIVGGSITIPHLRAAAVKIDQLLPQ